jgi:RND family efflux transporter MFP subunit
MRQIHLLLLVSLALAACNHTGQPAGDVPAEAAIPVTLAWAAGTSVDNIGAAGQVEAAQSATISTRVMGSVTSLPVKIGDKVAKGQLLATISARDLDAQRAQADAQIAAATAAAGIAHKDLDRYTTLFNEGSATASELENASVRYTSTAAALEAAKANRRQVEASLAYTRLTAPFDGTVTQKTTDVGSLASTGRPLLVIEQGGALQITATVAETDIARIKRGDKVHIAISAAGVETEGIVSQAGASSIASGGQYPIKISLPPTVQRQVYSGMYANIRFFAGSRSHSAATQGVQQVFVPAAALVHNDQLTGIYTVSNEGTALLRWLRTGKTMGGQVEILSGLAPGEPFILHADGRLYNGAPIRKK